MKRLKFSLSFKFILLSAKLIVSFLLLINTQLFSQLAVGHEKFLGNVYGNSSPPANWDDYWNQVTPENAGKWLYCETSQDNYSFGGADNVYNFAKQRGIPFKYHALIWGEQRPSWISTLSLTEQAEETEEWIRIIGERYPDMEFVDVVNEPLPGHDPNEFKEALGGAGETGYDWVIWAFEKARQYMPNSKLLINDYNILMSNSNTTTYLQIINLLKDRGLIDGISAQCHRSQIETASNETINGNLDRLAATGLPIYISEMDLGNIGNAGTPDDSVQLSLYQRIFPILWEHPGVKGITLWGYIQYQIWQSTCFLIRSDGTERPALQWLRAYLNTNNYKSFQSGDWNDVNSWQWYDGTQWINPVPNVPTPSNNAITILNGHTITITEPDSADQLTVASGGTLSIDPGTLLIVKNGVGYDLNVSGTIVNSGTISIEDSAIARFLSGGKYVHSRDGGTIPSATWGIGSTCEITGVTDIAPSNSAQNFYSFTWNCPGQNSNLNVGWQTGVNISGTLTVTSSNWDHSSTSSPSHQFRLFGGPGSCTINNIVVNGYNAVLTAQGSGYTDTVAVNGDITLSNGGMLSLSNNSGGITTYFVGGDLTVLDSAYIGKSNSANTSKFVFNGSGIQDINFPSNGVTFFGAPNIEVSSGSILNMGENVFGGAGSFRLLTGATLYSGHANGLDGNIISTGANGGGNSFSTGGYYTFISSTAQVTGSLLPDTVANLTINNSESVSLTNTVSVTGTLELKSGNLSLGANQLFYGPEATLKYSGNSAQTTSDMEFPLSGGPKNLYITNTSGVTLHSSRTIPGNIEVAGKLILGDNDFTAETVTNTGLTRFIVTNGVGMLKLTSVGTTETLFPLGTNFYAPVWITNDGTQDTIGASVVNDSDPAPDGGRVKVKWNLSENNVGDGNYTLKFGWAASLEDAEFRSDRVSYARIFSLTDTTEAGSGDYSMQFETTPYTVARGGITTLGSFAVGLFGPATGIDEEQEIPTSFSLSQNYPNPFNPSTTIKYSLAKPSNTKLIIYNVLGVKVRTLISEFQNAGEHTIVWDGKDDHNNSASSGVYLYRLETNDKTSQRKMILIR